MFDLPLQSIFVLILIISANFLAQLFPCRIQEMLKTNMYLKHFFGLLTMMFFAVLAVPDMSANIILMTLKTIILYIWFILITKADVYFFLAIMFCLLIVYLINIFKTNAKTQLTDVKKDNNNDIESLDKEIKTYDRYENILFIVTIILTVSGMMLYMGEKKEEYGSKFNYIYFFLGKPECKNNSPKIDYKNAFAYMFK